VDESLLEKPRIIAKSLVAHHPVLPAYAEHVTILLVGSLGSGFGDELSDVDLWVLCADAASSGLSADLKRAGLRFNELPPNEFSLEDLKAHYFVFPISRFRDALVSHDDYSLFLLRHSLVLHDPSRQFAALSECFASLPREVVNEKVRTAYSRVRIYAAGVGERLRRFQPVVWLEDWRDLVEWTLRLCCWLDAEPPAVSKWLFQHAAKCSTAPIFLPAVSQLLDSIGPALTHGRSGATGDPAIVGAAEAIASAARRAMDTAGFSDIASKVVLVKKW